MISASPVTHQVPWISIVIVAFNSGSSLQKCVDALARQSQEDFTAIVVDNHTPDDSVETLTLPDDRFKIIKASENLGFAGGSNFGLETAKTPYVMTLNPDVRLKKNCLKRLKGAALLRPNAAMLAPILLRTGKKKRLDGLGDVLSIFGIAWRGGYNQKTKKIAPTETKQIFAPCGAAAIYKREEFEKQNGFDEAFFCYLEDVDLGLRMNACGGTALLVHNAKAFHVGGESTAQISGFQDYYSCRNNLRMIIKSAPIALLPIMLIGHIASQAWITLRNIKDPRTPHRIRGYKDALKGMPAAFKARRQRPRYKFGSSLHVAKQLVWSKSSLKTLPAELWDLDDLSTLNRNS